MTSHLKVVEEIRVPDEKHHLKSQVTGNFLTYLETDSNLESGDRQKADSGNLLGVSKRTPLQKRVLLQSI